MMGILVAVAAVLAQVSGDGPGELVRRLGSGKFAEREAASAALEAIGPAALPALRAASDSKDLELRNRVTALVAKIEWRELARTSLIRLDIADRPLDAVLESFGFPSPSRLAWHPETPEAVRRRRVTIREPGPLPFWPAIDRLCRAGELRYIPGSAGGMGDGRPPEFRLFLAPGRVDCPRADHGPLRLEWTSFSHSRYINLIPNPDPPVEWPGRGAPPAPFGKRQEALRADLRLLAEPRIHISQFGDGLITEAVDDRGQSLLSTDGPSLNRFGSNYIPSQACIPLGISLKHPERAGNLIKRLKLIIPVEVVALKPDRLEVPLGDAMGKTFRHGKTSIEVLAVWRDPAGHQQVKVKLRSEESGPRASNSRPRRQADPVKTRPVRPEITPNVIQVLDQQGRQFPWHGDAPGSQGPEVTAELTLWPEGGIPIPVRVGQGIVPPEDRATAVPTVLYHTELARAVITATFEFTDIPLP